MNVRLTQTPLGYFEIDPKPSPRELREYYNNRYFGERETNQRGYSYPYTDEELAHKRIAAAEAIHYATVKAGSILEVGFGEGFFLEYFASRGWDIHGIDFTDDGINAFFPHLRSRVEIGDVYEWLDRAIDNHSRFDVIACNSLLEHVLDPVGLLQKLKAMMADGGIIRIQVPNDGSWLQKEIVSRGYADPDFWVCAPDHISYFNVESLHQLLASCGFRIIDLLADFPIDIFLFNPDSRYTRDRTRGRNCHFTRVAFETSLYKQSVESLLEFRRGCARAGVGRDLIAYVTLGS